MRDRIRVHRKTREQLADDQIDELINRYMDQIGGTYEQNEARLTRAASLTLRVGLTAVRFLARADGWIDMMTD